MSLRCIEAIREFEEDCLDCDSEVFVADRKARFHNSYLELEAVLKKLPNEIPFPEIVVEHSGEIGLEWRRDKKGFLISFGGEGIATFAGYFGLNNEFYGLKEIENFSNNFLMGFINELYSPNS